MLVCIDKVNLCADAYNLIVQYWDEKRKIRRIKENGGWRRKRAAKTADKLDAGD